MFALGMAVTCSECSYTGAENMWDMHYKHSRSSYWWYIYCNKWQCWRQIHFFTFWVRGEIIFFLFVNFPQQYLYVNFFVSYGINCYLCSFMVTVVIENFFRSGALLLYRLDVLNNITLSSRAQPNFAGNMQLFVPSVRMKSVQTSSLSKPFFSKREELNGYF